MLEEVRQGKWSEQVQHGSNRGEGVKKMVFKGIPGELTPSLAELTHRKGSSSPNCREANVHLSVKEGDSSGS